MRHVDLTEAQMKQARAVGVARFQESKGNPRFSYDTTAMSGQKAHIVGAQAELAFAESLSLPWPARVNTFRELPDVDPNWEVRWTSGHKVKVAVDDDPLVLVAVVVGIPPAFDIVGFVIAGAIQRKYPAIDPGDRGWKAHFAPFSVLAPIDDSFHSHCGWHQLAPDEWFCAFCGKAFEEDPNGSRK